MANEVYIAPETAIQFRASGGDVTFTPTSLANGAGRQSAFHALDGGSGAARAGTYAWRAFCKFGSAPTVGTRVDIYIKTSDGTNPDNDDGTGDAAVSAEDKLLNLTKIGSIIADENSTSPTFVASGSDLIITADDVAVVWWNESAVLSGTAGDHGFDLIPTPLQLQA